MIVYGIADAHGLESFKPAEINTELERFQIDPRELSFMSLRVNANRHRHAVIYQADVSGKDAVEIFKLIDEGEYTGALLKLKECAKAISLGRMPGAEKSWNLIPNPDLDPYS
jgi:hypothetical protein